MIAQLFAKRLAARVNERLARKGRFVVMRIHGSGLGDTLCLTSVMRRIHERYGWRFVIVTRFPELFLHHPLVDRLYAYPEFDFARRRIAKWMIRYCTGGPGSFVGEFQYRPGETPTHVQYMHDHSRRVHLAQLHSEHWGLGLDYSDLRNEVYFSDSESARFSASMPAPGSYALIKPTAGSQWTPNKDWRQDRFQQVVDAFPDLRWLQVGTLDEPLLANVADWRGRTTLRELLFLVSRARFLLAPEGFYNHAASAFEVPSFVLGSGYAHPELALYPNTIVIARQPQVACAPCWLREPCPVPGKPCTEDIAAEQVIAAISSRALAPSVRSVMG